MTASRTRASRTADAQPVQTLTMKHAGQTNGGNDKFGDFDKERPVNLNGYVSSAQMTEWREGHGGKSVVGLRVAITPVYEGDE